MMLSDSNQYAKRWMLPIMLMAALAGCQRLANITATAPEAITVEESTTRATGVQTPDQERTASTTRLEVAPEEYRRLFDAALLVLREAGFHLDRQDYRLGVITTRPQAAPTLFEPRSFFNKTASFVVENTFNDQRRIIRVQLRPKSPTDYSAYQLEVEVRLERRQHTMQRLEGSTDAPRIIGQLTADSTVPVQAQDFWRPMGRDAAVERVLLERIVRQSLSLTQP